MLKEVELILKNYNQENCCFIAKLADGSIYKADGRGVKPILTKLYTDRKYFKNAIVVDKVIGKAAAMLLIDSGAKFIHGELMSEYAIEVLKEYKIPYSYGKKAEFIKNRTNTGMCPLESSVQNIKDVTLAFDVAVKKVEELMKNNN